MASTTCTTEEMFVNSHNTYPLTADRVIPSADTAAEATEGEIVADAISDTKSMRRAGEISSAKASSPADVILDSI